MKNKITRWQAEHGTGAWVESLTEICETINSQTHESLPARVTPFQLMFSQNLSLQNTKKTNISQDHQAFLAQIPINDIDKICSDELVQKSATISEEPETTIEVALDMVPDKEVNHKSNSDPENPLEFKLVFSFFIKYMTDRTDIIILFFRNKSKQKAHETRSVSSSSPSTSSISPSPKTRHRSRQPTLLFSTKSDHRCATPRSKSPYFSIQSNLSAGNVSPPNVSIPEYLSPQIPKTLAAPIKPLSFLLLRPSPQQNWPSILSLSFQFQPVTAKLTESNLHRTGDAGSTSELSSSFCNTSTNLGGRNLRASGPVIYSKNILNFKIANFS